MGLIGKLVAAIEFKAGGDVFPQLLRHNPQTFPTITPGILQGFDLHEGQFGHVGAIISWKYTHDGKAKIMKGMMQNIDEEQKLLEFTVIEGDLVEEYKAFVVSAHVENKGDVDLVTWTLDYEMLGKGGEHPISILALVIDITKDIDAHHVGK